MELATVLRGDAVRAKVAKQMSEKSLFNAVHAAVKHKLNTSVFFVLGFPGDQVADFKETLKWARRLARAGVEDLAVGFYFPIPGTRFYKELQSRGKAVLTDELMMAPIFVHDRWLTEDRCDGTRVLVREGAVSVRVKKTGKTSVVRAGRSFLARARR